MVYRLVIKIELQKIEDGIPLVSSKDISLESYELVSIQEAHETLEEVDRALMGGSLAHIFRDRSLVR